MSTSVRSYLVAGAAAATATAIALTPVQATPADIAVPAHPTSTQPQLSQAMIDLLAAASRMTAAVTPKSPTQTGAAPALGVAPMATVPGDATVQPAAIPIAPNLANTIDQIYVDVEPWVQYGFEVAASIIGWVPWVGWAAGGLLMDAYTFGESLVASGVFNFTDWLRGDGGIIQNLADFGADAALSVVWLGLDIVSTFVPLPPIPLPPRPPLQGPFLASLAAPGATLEGVTQIPFKSVSDALTKAGQDFAATIEKLTEGTGLAVLTDRLKSGAVAGADAPVAELVGSTVESAVEGTVETAVEGAKEASAELTALKDTVKAVSGPADEQAEHEAAGIVPRSVRQSLRGVSAPTTVTDAQDTTEETSASRVRSVRNGIRDAVEKSAADTKKATGAVRSALTSARDKAADRRTDKADGKAPVKKTKSESGKNKPAKDKHDKK